MPTCPVTTFFAPEAQVPVIAVKLCAASYIIGVCEVATCESAGDAASTKGTMVVRGVKNIVGISWRDASQASV